MSTDTKQESQAFTRSAWTLGSTVRVENLDLGINSPDEILPGLWLGGFCTAQNETWLRRVGIEYIADIGSDNTNVVSGIHYLHPKPIVDDDPKEHISVYFNQTYVFIKRAMEQKKPLLVHCHAGVSRSVTIVCYYLMREYQLSFKDALDRIKQRRWGISPNHGFCSQLKRCTPTLVHVQYKLPPLAVTKKQEDENKTLLLNKLQLKSSSVCLWTHLLDGSLWQVKSNVSSETCANHVLSYAQPGDFWYFMTPEEEADWNTQPDLRLSQEPLAHGTSLFCLL